HHWNPKGWAALTLALKRAGFFLTNRYVVHSENPVSVHIASLNALTHDAILVCAPEKGDVEIEWQAPEHICTDDSRDFTEQCADLLGQLLMSEYSEDEMRAQWPWLLPV